MPRMSEEGPPTQRLRFWLPPVLLGALWCVLQVLGGPGLWGYERLAIGEGQAWRLLTGHLVHLNAMHLVLNLLGFAGVVAVWGQELARPSVLLATFLASALATSLGLWFQPQLDWYAGASAALHGLFAAGIVLASGAQRMLRLTAALGLLLKLALETQIDTGTAGLIGAPVIHAAHQFGALGGALAALAWRLRHRDGVQAHT